MRRTEVDGLPVYWTEAAEFTVGLMFRVGRADEPLPRRGITHLLEHLVTYAVYPEDDEVDGTVHLGRTTFEWCGERERALQRLRALCAAVAAPFGSRLTDELRILRIEGDNHSLAEQALRERCGATGFGAAAFPQYAHGWVGEDEVRRWAGRYLTRGNAGVWMTGQPPETLGIELPDGPRIAPPRPETIPGLRLPAQRWFDDDGVAVTLLGAHTRALSCAMEIAAARAQARLRYELALTYSVDDDYELLDGRTAHAYLQADCLEAHAGEVREGLLAVLQRLADDGPTPAELQRVVERRLKEIADPAHAAWQVERTLLEELLGMGPRTGEEERAELLAVTPAAAAAALGAALDSMLVLAPESLEALPELHAFDARPDDPPVSGAEYPPRDEGLLKRLVVGETGVSVIRGDVTTARFAETRGAIRRGSGTLELIGREGDWLYLHADEWERGEEVLDAVLAALPSDVIFSGPPLD